MRKTVLYAGLWCATLSLACGQANKIDSQTFSSNEWGIINTLSPLPDLPVDTTNRYRDSAPAALLGQKLFFEPRLSGPIQTGTRQEGQLGAIGEKYKIACRNCHRRQLVRNLLCFLQGQGLLRSRAMNRQNSDRHCR